MKATKISSIFDKPIHSLDTSDLMGFFSRPQSENNILEFKSYVDYPVSGTTKPQRDKEKLHDVLRTLTAFLNSDGGILIWGAPTGVLGADGSEKIFSGQLTAVDLSVEKDQFISKVCAEISPTPAHIHFQRIAAPANGYYYIIEVQQSEFPPHQYKGTYYMRMDGSTRPAPHHYVEALIKKINFPKIEGYLHFGRFSTHPNELVSVAVQLTIHNLSKFAHEKNLHYRIVATNCSILPADHPAKAQQLIFETDFSQAPRPMLHYNMPYYENFLLIAKRIWNNHPPVDIEILLTIWGELSPVIACQYKLRLLPHGQTKDPLELIHQTENKYLHEQAASAGSDPERIKRSNQLLFEQYAQKVSDTYLYQQLSGQAK